MSTILRAIQLLPKEREKGDTQKKGTTQILHIQGEVPATVHKFCPTNRITAQLSVQLSSMHYAYKSCYL